MCVSYLLECEESCGIGGGDLSCAVSDHHVGEDPEELEQLQQAHLQPAIREDIKRDVSYEECGPIFMKPANAFQSTFKLSKEEKAGQDTRGACV